MNKKQTNINDDSNDEEEEDEYCTCEKYKYKRHICSYQDELYNDKRLCSCCSYCTDQCYYDV